MCASAGVGNGESPARARASSAGRAHSDRTWGSPADQLVEHLDILLHVRHLHRLLGVDDGERRERGAVVDVLAAGLEEAADEEEFEEGDGVQEDPKEEGEDVASDDADAEGEEEAEVDGQMGTVEEA